MRDEEPFGEVPGPTAIEVEMHDLADGDQTAAEDNQTSADFDPGRG